MGGIVDLAMLAARGGMAAATGGASGIISQLLNIIPSIFQGITGRNQLKQASQIEAQNPRPEAVIAPSIEKATNFAYGKTLASDIPGGEMYRNEIKGATAAGMRQASELSEGSEAYGMFRQLVGREQNALGDMAKTTAQQVAGYDANYQEALMNKANEENRIWQWNEGDKYLSAAAIAQQLRDSGLRNVNSGMKNVFGSTAEYINPDFNSSLLYGNNNKGTKGEYSIEDVTRVVNSLKGIKG
jgi:hypothetical protein